MVLEGEVLSHCVPLLSPFKNGVALHLNLNEDFFCLELVEFSS